MFQIVHKDVHAMVPVIEKAMHDAFESEYKHGSVGVAKGLFENYDDLKEEAKGLGGITVTWTITFKVNAGELIAAVEGSSSPG